MDTSDIGFGCGCNPCWAQ